MSWAYDVSKAIIGLIVPPTRSEPGKLYLYRIRVTLVACAAFLGLMATWPLATGMMPTIFEGFARTSSVENVYDKLTRNIDQLKHRINALQDADDSHWANQAADSLLQLDQQRCALPAGGARQLYDQLIQDRLREYQHITGTSYPLPDCRAL